MTYLETAKQDAASDERITANPYPDGNGNGNGNGNGSHALEVSTGIGVPSPTSTLYEESERSLASLATVVGDAPTDNALLASGLLVSPTLPKAEPAQPAGAAMPTGAHHALVEQTDNVHAGLRKRSRVVLVLAVTAAVVAGAVITARTLAADSSSNFAGVLAAKAPVELNFPAAGILQAVDVVAGQHVRVGQVLASQSSSVATAAVKSDKLELASDEERLAALLGPAAAASEQQVAQAYQNVEALAASQVARGAQAVDTQQSVLMAAEQQAATWTSRLATDTAAYGARCQGTPQPGCGARQRSIVSDQSALARAKARVSRDQQSLSRAEGTDTVLASVASQEDAIAQQKQTGLTATMAVDLSEARDAVSQDQEKLAADMQALGYTTLTSPVNGIVQSVSGAGGEIVQPAGDRTAPSSSAGALPGTASTGTTSPTSVSRQAGVAQPLVTIDAGADLEAIAQVPEQDIAKVLPGRRASISVNSLDGRVVQAKVQAVEPQPVDVHGTVYYDVVLMASGRQWVLGGLLPGMTINVHLR